MAKPKNNTNNQEQEEVYSDNWSEYSGRDGKRYDRKKQEIENARRRKNKEKDSFFLE
jgi:molecular chaperone GrpE (heat shock protein)